MHVKDLEQRLSQMAGELSIAHSSVADLERRLNGCLLKAEADAMVQRLAEAEDAASKAQATVSGVAYKAQVRRGMASGASLHSCNPQTSTCSQDAERRATEALRDRRRHLAEITTLKAALRDVSARSEQAALIGKLHLEIDHLRYERLTI